MAWSRCTHVPHLRMAFPNLVWLAGNFENWNPAHLEAPSWGKLFKWNKWFIGEGTFCWDFLFLDGSLCKATFSMWRQWYIEPNLKLLDYNSHHLKQTFSHFIRFLRLARHLIPCGKEGKGEKRCWKLRLVRKGKGKAIGGVWPIFLNWSIYKIIIKWSSESVVNPFGEIICKTRREPGQNNLTTKKYFKIKIFL